METSTSFILRPWQISDIDSLVKYANNKKISDNLTNAFPNPDSCDDGIKFIKIQESYNPAKAFAIVIDNEACGAIGVFQQTDIHEKNAEMGYWLAEKHWGKGVITNAIKQTVEYGFKNFEINRIFARPFGSNLASQKVLEKAGFKFEAKFKNTIYKNGQFLDEIYYAIYK
ncbi:MAG: GNAT family N-acetyltransferase [Bacteroidia bacterium]|nr:GNAT family N-acetyltransferase [Bacteroidia bacterium]